MSIRQEHKGFSLVELMVAMTLGLLLIAAVGALFFANKRNYEQNSKIAEMQSHARFALQALSRDLAMAGFRGGLSDGSRMSTHGTAASALASDCGKGVDGESGWAFDTASLEFLDNATASGATSTYGCLATDEVKAGTDILTVRRTAGLATDRIDTSSQTPTLAPNTFYLRTNRTVGSVFFSGADASNPANGQPPTTPPMSFWTYQSRLYFVRPYADQAGDDIPTLCRYHLVNSASASVETECVAEGVENLQIAFGIDTNGDGTTNRYLADPTRQQLANAITARVQLLMRATRPDHGYNNNKSYNLLGVDDDGDGSIDESGESYQPDDAFYRRVVQTTIQLNNPAIPSGSAP